MFSVEVLKKTVTAELKPDYFTLSCHHKDTGPPDFIDYVTDNYYKVPKISLGVKYTFTLKCFYSGVSLNCGSWSEYAYPDCPDGWAKDIKFCYQNSGAKKMTKAAAIITYHSSISGLMATYSNQDSDQQFIKSQWPDVSALIVDKSCVITDCCYRYFKNDLGVAVFEKSCDASVTDVSQNILFVQYVPVHVSNCTDIDILMNEIGDTVITFARQQTGWPTLMKSQVLNISSMVIYETEITKSDINITVSNLSFNLKYNFKCIPYMTEDWQFQTAGDYFINVNTNDGKFGAFKPPVEIVTCSRWNGQIQFQWPIASAKFLDPSGTIVNIAADSYDIFYQVQKGDQEAIEQFETTKTSFSILSLELLSNISADILCVFGTDMVPCAVVDIVAEPPKVVRSNVSHIMTYELIREKMTWQDSEFNCQACDGHLASIDSKENEKPLQEFSDVKEQFHVGIQSCAGSSGKWTDGKLFTYIPENGHVYYKDRCCGTVSADSSGLQVMWVACEALHQHSCLKVIPKPELKITCEAVSTTEILCVWSQEGTFWKPSSYNVSCTDVSKNEDDSAFVVNIANYTIPNLSEFTKHRCKVSTKPLGYSDIFTAEQILYTGFKAPVDWSIDSKGLLNISWPKFIAFGEESQKYNLTCDQSDMNATDTKLFHEGSDPSRISLKGLLYGYSYICQLQGKHKDGSLIHSIFNFSAIPSCDKDEVAVENFCLTSSIGSSNSSKTTIFDKTDVKKEDLVSIVNDSVIWVNSSSESCCSTSLDALNKVTCTTDLQECSKNHTIIVSTDKSPPFCKLKDVQVVPFILKIILKIVRSECWGDHFIKITHQKFILSERRKRSTPITDITKNSSYTIENLEAASAYLVRIEPATADGLTSSDPDVITELTVNTLTEETTTPESTSTTDLTSTSVPEMKPKAALFQEIVDEPLIALRIAACSIVILCVGFTLIIYIYTRMFYQDSLCMLSSSICIIAAYISILLGTVEVHHITYEMCLTMALFLHFFFLATFTFFLLEFLCMSCLLANIPRRHLLTNSWYIFAAGWALPFVIVAITVGVLHNDYVTDKNCWIDIDGKAFLPVIIPMSIIIICSFFFVLILLQSHELDKDQMKLRDFERAKECLSTRWSTIILLIICSIAWILGFMAENKNDRNLYVGFIIMSFMLGFSYIITRCLAESEVRHALASIFCCLPANDSYRWGTYTSHPKVKDVPENQSRVNLTKSSADNSLAKELGSMASLSSTQSDLSSNSMCTISTTSSGESSRPGSGSSYVAPLRQSSSAFAKPPGRFRPGTAAIKR